jgi:uncharacterized protein YjbI with pentapeptide repeats
MLTNKNKGSSFFSLMVLAIISSPGYADIISDKTESLSQSLSISAKSASVQRGNDPDSATLSMKVSGYLMVSFSPSIAVKSIRVRSLNKKRFASIFEASDIPAVLTWTGKYGESGAVLSAQLISINDKTGSIKFRVKSAPSLSPVYSGKSTYIGAPLKYGVLKDATLFLADEQGRVIRFNSDNTASPVGNIGFLDKLGSWVIRSAIADTTIGTCVIQPFTECEGANLNYANLQGADLYEANLSGAMIGYADMTAADFTGANLGIGTNSYGTYGVNMTNSTLTGATFTGVNMPSAYLGFASVISANFTGANINSSNFEAANVTSSNFSNANLNFVSMSGATGCRTTTPPLNPKTYGCYN